MDQLQEPNKFLVSVSGHAVSDDCAIEHAQSREQRRRAVARIVVGLAFGNAGAQRGCRSCPIEGLNLTLLVDAENQSLVGRVEVKPHHIVKLFAEVLVFAEFEGFDKMRLQVVSPPNTSHSRLAEPLRLGHAPSAPVSRVGWRAVQCCGDNSIYFSLKNSWLAPRTRSIFLQPGKTQGQESLAPQLNRGSRYVQFLSDVLAQKTIGGQANNLGALDLTERKAPPQRPSVQCLALLGS